MGRREKWKEGVHSRFGEREREEITFYKGYAYFPTFDLFRETSSQ